MRDAGIGLEELNNVVLVGGSTRVPLVRQQVADYFGKAPLSDIDPDRVVAIGAAVQANVLIGREVDPRSHTPAFKSVAVAIESLR